MSCDFFIESKGYGVRLPAGQEVYLTASQRQNHSYILSLKEVGYAEPRWIGVLSPYEKLELRWGDLISFPQEITDSLAEGLSLSWVRGEQSLSRSQVAKPLLWDWKQLRDESHSVFREVTGLNFSDFHEKTLTLTRALWQRRERGGRKDRYGVEDYLYLTLLYRQGKHTYQALSQLYGISASRLYEIVQWVEQLLFPKDKKPK